MEPSPAAASARGALAFAPDALATAANLRVVEARTGTEVPAAVRVLSSWPDGSVQLAEITLRVPAAPGPRWFWAESGPEVARTLPAPPDPPGEGIDLSEGEVPLEIPDTAVGTMLIRVEPHADWYYWGYLLPIGAILGILGWRRARLGRAGAPR